MKTKTILAFALALLLQSPALAAYQSNSVQFAGDGSGGNITKSGTSSTIEDINAVTFTVASGQTWNAESGTRVNSQREITISGTINVSPGFTGPPAQVFAVAYGVTADGSGPGGGRCTESAAYGGNGAGFGGLGGAGGSADTANHAAEGGGRPYKPWVFPCGSAGGAGHFNHNDGSGSGGAGGDAGGCLKLISGKTITLASGSVISLPGGNGGAGTGSLASGGGGGSGGLAFLAALQAIYIQGTNSIAIPGGNGGNSTGPAGSAGNGGGGAGGWAVLIAPVVSITGSINKTGGSAGTPASTGRGGAAGGDGQTLVLQQRPTMPLLVLLEQTDIIPFIKTKFPRQNEIWLTEAEFEWLKGEYFLSKRAS